MCGLSRTKIDKALVLASLQSKTHDKRLANLQRDLGGKTIVHTGHGSGASNPLRRKMMGKETKMNLKAHEHMAAAAADTQTHTQIQEQAHAQHQILQKETLLRELQRSGQSRRCSTDAPMRHTIAEKAIEGYTQNNRHYLNKLRNNPGSKDFSQYRMVEITPPYNKSSRSSHFVSAGYLEYRAGGHWPSVNIFTRAIETNPRNWLAFFWRGIAFDKVGQFVRGIKDLTQSIKVRARLAKEEAGDGLYADPNGEREEVRSNKTAKQRVKLLKILKTNANKPTKPNNNSRSN